MNKFLRALLYSPILLGFALFITVVYSQRPEEELKVASVRLKSLTPNLMVADMGKTIDYYRDVLGFELMMSAPEEAPFDWAMMKSGGVSIMFQTQKSLGEELAAFKEIAAPGGSLTFYVDVADINVLYDRVKGKADLLKELFGTSYGTREFIIRDCNGYLIVFAEDSEQE